MLVCWESTRVFHPHNQTTSGTTGMPALGIYRAVTANRLESFSEETNYKCVNSPSSCREHSAWQHGYPQNQLILIASLSTITFPLKYSKIKKAQELCNSLTSVHFITFPSLSKSLYCGAFSLWVPSIEFPSIGLKILWKTIVWLAI